MSTTMLKSLHTYLSNKCITVLSNAQATTNDIYLKWAETYSYTQYIRKISQNKIGSVKYRMTEFF